MKNHKHPQLALTAQSLLLLSLPLLIAFVVTLLQGH
jgi:hypothetical protein